MNHFPGEQMHYGVSSDKEPRATDVSDEEPGDKDMGNKEPGEGASVVTRCSLEQQESLVLSRAAGTASNNGMPSRTAGDTGEVSRISGVSS